MWSHCAHAPVIPCPFLRVAFAEILPKPSHPFSLFMPFLGLCLMSTFNKLPGVVHRLTFNWLTHAGGLCLSFTQTTGLRTLAQTRACPTLWRWPLCQPHSLSIFRGSWGGGGGMVALLAVAVALQQPGTRLTPEVTWLNTAQSCSAICTYAAPLCPTPSLCPGKILTEKTENRSAKTRHVTVYLFPNLKRCVCVCLCLFMHACSNISVILIFHLFFSFGVNFFFSPLLQISFWRRSGRPLRHAFFQDEASSSSSSAKVGNEDLDYSPSVAFARLCVYLWHYFFVDPAWYLRVWKNALPSVHSQCSAQPELCWLFKCRGSSSDSISVCVWQVPNKVTSGNGSTLENHSITAQVGILSLCLLPSPSNYVGRCFLPLPSNSVSRCLQSSNSVLCLCFHSVFFIMCCFTVHHG